MAHTFTVDAVEPAKSRLAERPLSERYPGVLALGTDGVMPTVETSGLHPLMAAVHLAFSEHRPLVLSPDAIWLTIAQGVAQHIRLNADRLRGRLVRHEGKKRLEVRLRTSFPEDATGIAALIDRMRGVLSEEVGAGARLFTCDFSTSGEAERVASEIILLDAFSPYFDYLVSCVCGIPELTVTGTPDDWRAIRQRVDVIAELDLAWWTSSLAGIIDRFIDAANGKPDVAFFKRIYKPQVNYSADRVTGWIARLWPYVFEGGSFRARNPLLQFTLDWQAPEAPHMQFNGPGIPARHVPSGPSRCLFEVRNQLTQGRLADVELAGGLLAVEQDERGRLIPRASWFATRSRGSMGFVLEQIIASHSTTPVVALENVEVRARASGIARFLDFSEGVTTREQVDERTGLTATEIMATSGLRPRVVIGDAEHELQPSAMLRIADGAQVVEGTVVASYPARDRSGTAETLAFDDQLLKATLFLDRRPWTIRAWNQRTYVDLVLPHDRVSACRVIDLPDGTFLAYIFPGLQWVRLRDDLLEHGEHRLVSTEDAAQVPVVATSLAELLQRALDTGGSLELPALAMLFDVLPEYMKAPPPRVHRSKRD